MKSLPRTFAFVLLSLPALLPARAAGAAVELPGLRVSVTSVSETRRGSTPVSKASATLSVYLSIASGGLPSNAFLRQLAVTKVVDNQDRPLGTGAPLIISFDPWTGLMTSMPTSGPFAGTFRSSVLLTALPRDAASLKLLEGTVEIFTPSESTGSIVRVLNIKSHPGRIEDPILARHGIEFHFLGNKATADEARALAPIPRRYPLAVAPDSIAAVAYYYSDPSGKLGGVELQDSKGNRIQTRSPTAPGSSGPPRPGSSGDFLSAVLSAPLPADAQLVIYILAPEAIKSAPFRIENIALP